MFQDLKGKRILVIGAKSGIGAALSKHLVDFGCLVDGTCRQKPDQSICSGNINGSVFVVDFDDTASWAELLASETIYDGICVVAGRLKLVPSHMITPTISEQLTTQGLASPIALIASLMKKKKVQRGGSLIFTSSVSRTRPTTSSALYAACKAGLVAAAKCMAMDWERKKIRVNCVSFDYVKTPMTENIEEMGEEEIVGVAEADDVVCSYLFLLSDKSRWMTKSVLAMDAGRKLGKAMHV